MSGKAGGSSGDQESADRALATRIDQLLQAEAGIYVAVRVTNGVAHLDGMVESAEQRDAATDLAAAVEGIVRVENDLDVEEFGLPGGAAPSDEMVRGDTSYQMLEGDREADPEPLQEEAEIDFNEPVPKIGADMTSDTMIAVEEGIPYIPPTDPVVRPTRDDQDITPAVGFGTTSMDEYPDTLGTTALGDAPPGDEDIRQQVVEALRTDAATADLTINVHVHNGIVRLRGRVPTLNDAEAAEEVAGRIPEVREVVEELDVAALE